MKPLKTAMKTFPVLKKFYKLLSVTQKTASENVLASIDNINFITDDIRENLATLKSQAESGNFFSQTSGIIDRLRDKALAGQDTSFDIIAALEFQDITKQKIDKLVKIIYDLQERLAHLVVMYGVKDDKVDIEILEKMKSKENVLEDQSLVDELMKEFGQ